MPPPIMGGSIIIVDEQKNLPRFDVDQLHYVKLRVCTDPGKSWNLKVTFSRPV